jgi:hypothetical protein
MWVSQYGSPRLGVRSAQKRRLFGPCSGTGHLHSSKFRSSSRFIASFFRSFAHNVGSAL